MMHNNSQQQSCKFKNKKLKHYDLFIYQPQICKLKNKKYKKSVNYLYEANIWWKFHSALIQVVVRWSLWNSVHDMTALLSWHVQNFVATWYPTMELHWRQFSIEFQLLWKNCSRNGPQLSVSHWGWDEMAANFLMTFSNAFSWMKIYKFQLRFHWSLFRKVQLTIFEHSFR